MVVNCLQLSYKSLSLERRAITPWAFIQLISLYLLYINALVSERKALFHWFVKEKLIAH
jgi:hypothetical protein